MKLFKIGLIVVSTSLLIIVSGDAAKIGLGMSGAVKNKVEELDKKIKDDRAAQTTPVTNGDNNGGDEEPQTIDEKVEKLLSQMSIDEKIGQMTQVERDYLSSTSDITTYYLGSLLSGGGSTPSPNTPTSWADMYDNYQSYSLQTPLKIPLIYGIDAVHGHNNVYSAVIFPHNIGLGCTRNTTLMEQAARITAEEVAGTGINWTFAPCIAVARDERWGRTYESFGETPDLVKEMGAAAVRGFQGTSLATKGNILACPKHYVGDGGTTNGIDQGNTVLDEATLREIHMQGYVSAIAAGAKSIMVSFSSWNGEKLHGHKYLLTDVLKGELGFTGFLISDWAGIKQLSGDYSTQIETAINAGLDMIMVPDNYKTFITNLKNSVGQGKVSTSRIDDAVRRILKVKYELGLFDNPDTDRTFTSTIGLTAHREVARQCVRESLVLLKNENNILPLAKNNKKIFVAGKNANDLGNQCGGWTISWQGSSGDITVGTTILKAIQNSVTVSTVTYYSDGSGASGYDVGIVVIGERPYAEGNGYDNDLALDTEDITAVTNVKNAGIPTVVILISGRPLILEPILNKCDALVAAWLPGTEGQGVADVLFGDYNFTGKLSISWPRSISQVPINYGDANYDPLYPYGYGLSYSTP